MMPAPAPPPVLSPSLVAKLQAMSPDQLAAVESFVDLMNTRGPAAAAQVFAQTADLPGLSARLDLASAEEPWQPVRGKDTERLIALIKSNKNRRYLLALAGAVVLVVGVVLLLPEAKQNDAAPPADTVLPAAPTAPPRDDAQFAYVRLNQPRSLANIAEALWDDPERASLLLQHNPDAGDVNKPMPSDSVVKIPRHMDYTVASGDTLGYIAEDLLGEAGLFTVIYEANREVLPDPSGVEVGMKLKIPILPPAAEQKLTSFGTPP